MLTEHASSRHPLPPKQACQTEPNYGSVTRCFTRRSFLALSRESDVGTAGTPSRRRFFSHRRPQNLIALWPRRRTRSRLLRRPTPESRSISRYVPRSALCPGCNKRVSLTPVRSSLSSCRFATRRAMRFSSGSVAKRRCRSSWMRSLALSLRPAHSYLPTPTPILTSSRLSARP